MSTPMTKQGLEKLKAELSALEAKALDLARKVEIAREKGDLRENAEYHAAREDLMGTNTRITDLQGRIASATIVDTSKSKGDAIVFGATVKLRNLDDKEEEEFTLVGDGEADPFSNKILTTSPMGQAMLTKKVGETVEVPAPKKTLRYKVLEIRFDG
ncbi:MAG: transcription elongation factor GreA [Planctomycetota bacterium]|nr:transcription elongation factor GreA [Planctomycetota bacterium]